MNRADLISRDILDYSKDGARGSDYWPLFGIIAGWWNGIHRETRWPKSMLAWCCHAGSIPASANFGIIFGGRYVTILDK